VIDDGGDGDGDGDGDGKADGGRVQFASNSWREVT